MNTETITIDQFQNVDLRVAEVCRAERVEGTDRLLRLEISTGENERQIVAGIGAAYEPDDLVGKRIVIVANLEPARIRGVESQGMLLAAEDASGQMSLVGLDRTLEPGARVC